MIKRDTIQRVVLMPTDDGMGGQPATKDYGEVVRAMVSNNTTMQELTQYGIKEQIVLNVVTDIKLDEYINTRYSYQEKLFKIMRQVKQGNEWFSVLVEVNEG